MDEPRRDELLERVQVRYHPGTSQSIADFDDDDTVDDADDDQEVGREDIGREAADEEDAV
jgi:hypothetical protein